MQHRGAVGGSFVVLVLFCTIFFGGCRDKEPEKEAVARVFDQYLYQDDLIGLLQGAVNAQDSQRLKKDFIDNWIKQQLALKIAEENVADALDGIEAQTEDYRNSLILYAFEQKWIEQRLDTLVTAEQIETYYEDNQQNFVLKEDVYRLDYVLVEPNVVNYDSLRIWFDRADRYELNIERYCLTYCLACYLKSDKWFAPSDLRNRFQGAEINTEPLERGKVLEVNTDILNGLFLATDKRRKGSIGPLPYFVNDIRKILIGTRKMELIRNTYRDIYLDGGKRNQYEIY